MPAPASSTRASAPPHDPHATPDADRGAPPVPGPCLPRPSRTPPCGARGDENLVLGYLLAVPAALEHGIAVTTLHWTGRARSAPGPGGWAAP
jgi:hypothetical protein